MALVGLVRRVLKLFKVKRGQVYFGCIVILPLDAKYSKPLSDLYLELRLVLVSGFFFLFQWTAGAFNLVCFGILAKQFFSPSLSQFVLTAFRGFGLIWFVSSEHPGSWLFCQNISGEPSKGADRGRAVNSLNETVSGLNVVDEQSINAP